MRVFTCNHTQSGARRLGILFSDRAADVFCAALAQRVGVERQGAGEQLIEYGSERVDVRARVDVLIGHLGLLRTHILRRAHHLALLRDQGPLGQQLTQGLGQAEIDDLGHGLAAVNGHLHIGGLDVAVDYAF